MAAQRQSINKLFHAILTDNFSLSPTDLPNINKCNEEGKTLLHYAASEGKTTAITLLLAKGADVCVHDLNGYTPLHYAAKKGSAEIVKLLIDNNASTDDTDNDGATPLHLAARHNQLQTVNALLEAKADVNQDDKNSVTPLHYAAQAASAESARELIEKGANLDAKDMTGLTPLHVAAKKGCTEIINFLIEKGANLHAKDARGLTPLHYAVQENCSESVKALIEQSADLNAKNSEDLTPLHCAAKKGSTEIVKLLIEKGASKDATNCTEATPLHFAAANNHSEVVQVLLEAKANLNPKDVAGATPLHYAARYGCYENVKALIQKGALLDAKDKEGATPLIFAIKNGFHAIGTLIQEKEIERILRAYVSAGYEYKIDEVSDQIHIVYQKSLSEISFSIDTHLRLFCIYIFLLERMSAHKTKISVQFNSEKPSLVLKNYKQDIDHLKTFLGSFEQEEHDKKFNTWSANLETILATFAVEKSGLRDIQWQYLKTSQPSNKKQRKPQPPRIQLSYRFNDAELAKQFIEQLKLAEMGYLSHEGCNVKIPYDYSILSDAEECKKYCDGINKKQQLRLQKRESTKNKKSEGLAQKEKIAPLQTPTEIPLVKAEIDHNPPVFIIDLKQRPELSDSDKQKAADRNLPVLIKRGDQFTIGEYVNGRWQESEINLKDFKQNTRDLLTRLGFKPRLAESTELSPEIINKLRTKQIQNLNIPVLQPAQDIPLQGARRKKLATRPLQVEGASTEKNKKSDKEERKSDKESTKEDKKNILKQPMSLPCNKSTVGLKSVEGGLSQSMVIPSSQVSTAIIPTTSVSDSTHTFFRDPERVNYKLDGTVKADVTKLPKERIDKRKETALTQARPDDCLRGHLNELHTVVDEDEDRIIRAIYYRVIQAFIPESKCKLKRLRDKFAHQSDMGCFLDKSNPKRQLLLELAQSFAQGKVLTDQRIAQMTQEIDKIQAKTKDKSDEELRFSIVQELKALEINFRIFLKEGNMPQFFNATRPDHSDACKASVILIAECCKKMSKKPEWWKQCINTNRNILAHESEYSQEPQMAGILAPSINEGDFRDLCRTLSEIAKSLPKSSSATPPSSSSSSNASSLAKPSL